MNEQDLRCMLIEAYERGLSDGKKIADYESDRVNGWMRLQNRLADKYTELVTI